MRCASGLGHCGQSCKMALNHVICLLLALTSSVTHSQEDVHFVEPSLILVEKWEGWGTSLAWWADMLGGMEDAVMKNVTESFFSKDHLNFNIVRYVIGGTTPEDVVPLKCGPYRAGAATESFRDGPNEPYIWTRDARQIKILREAISLGANILEAFSNSPPQWMTISGCAKGHPQNYPLHQNFDAVNATAFAQYIGDVLQHFHTELGITFQYYAPFNEPFGLLGIGSWVGLTSEQEGCNMRRPAMVAILKAMQALLEEREMTWVTLTGADETNINTAIKTARYFLNETVAHYLTKWNVHGYWDVPRFLFNRRDILNKIAYTGGQKLWMDEMGWPSTPQDNMTQAFDISRRILSDLRNMNPSAWVYWQAMEGEGQWGIVSVPYRFDATLEEVQYNSGYYAMMQFSHYIKQDYQLIFVSDPNSVSAFDPVSKTLVLVTTHEDNTTISRTFDLHRFSGDKTTITTLTRSSPSEHHANILGQANVANLTNGRLTLTLSPMSITTLVISGLSPFSPEVIQAQNQLINPDFEATSGGWKFSTNGTISETYPWRGGRHAWLPALVGNYLGENLVEQSITVPAGSKFNGGSLYLTVYVSSTGADTWVEARVNGKKVAESFVDFRPGYRAYGLVFRAKTGDVVNIRINSKAVVNPVYVDNAQLYWVDSETVEDDPSGGGRAATWSHVLGVGATLLAIFKTFHYNGK